MAILVGLGFDGLSVRSDVETSLWHHQVRSAQCISNYGAFSILHFLFLVAQPIVLNWKSINYSFSNNFE